MEKCFGCNCKLNFLSGQKKIIEEENKNIKDCIKILENQLKQKDELVFTYEKIQDCIKTLENQSKQKDGLIFSCEKMLEDILNKNCTFCNGEQSISS